MIAVDRKGAVVVRTTAGVQAVGKGVGTRLGGAEGADNRTRGRPIGNRLSGQRQGGGGHHHIEGDNLVEGIVVFVRGADANAQGRGRGLEFVGRQQLVATDGEGGVIGRAGAGDEAIGEGMAGAGFRRSEDANEGVGRPAHRHGAGGHLHLRGAGRDRIAEIPCQSEISTRVGVGGGTANEDTSVRLDAHRVGGIGAAGEVRGDQTAGAEVQIESAVGVIACQGENGRFPKILR